MRYALALAIAAATLLYDTQGASAAIRVCQEIVSSDITSAADEMTAKKQAIEQWRTKAKKSGEGFDVWRLAASKSLKCFKREDGQHECVAFGAPCLIQQNPNKKPAGKDSKDVEF